MDLKLKATALAATLCMSLGAAAQVQNLPEPMINAARKAVNTNPEVQARWNGFQAADNERDVARGGFFPKIDLTSTIGRRDLETPGTDYGKFNFNSTQLSLDQMLFDGMFTANETKRLGLAKLTRYHELREIAENTTLEALRAYMDVLRYRELVDAATQNYVEHKQSALLVEERSKSGVGRGVDVEQANGRLALAEYNLLVELTNLHDVSARYLRVVGEKPPVSLPPLPDPFKLGTLPPTAEVMMREGLQNSPTLNAAVENALSYQAAIDTRNSAYLPRIDLRLYQKVDHDTDGISGRTDDKGISLTLNYNLYRGGADKARERQALSQHAQALDLQLKACRDVRQTLSIAYSDVQSLASQQAFQDAHRLATEKSLDAYRQQFEIGQRTLLDVLDSQNEFFEATRSYINSRYNQAIAQARTLAGMGQLVGALGVTRTDVPATPQDAGQEHDTIDMASMCPVDNVVVDSLEKIKAEAVLPPRVPRAAGAAPVPVTAAAAKTTLSADALFDFDKSTLKPEGMGPLKTLSDNLQSVPVEQVKATGHTDAMGSDAYNLKLSKARAESVKAYLVSRGMDPKRVEVFGKGESEPVADNATEEGRAKNRRVEVQVIEAKPAAQ